MHLQNVPRAQQKNWSWSHQLESLWCTNVGPVYVWIVWHMFCKSPAVPWINHWTGSLTLLLDVSFVHEPTQKSDGRRCPEKHMSAWFRWPKVRPCEFLFSGWNTSTSTHLQLLRDERMFQRIILLSMTPQYRGLTLLLGPSQSYSTGFLLRGCIPFRLLGSGCWMCCLASASSRNSAVWCGLPVPAAVLHFVNSWQCSTEDVGTSTTVINPLPEPPILYTNHFRKVIGFGDDNMVRPLPHYHLPHIKDPKDQRCLFRAKKPRTTLNLLFLAELPPQGTACTAWRACRACRVCGMAWVAPFGHRYGKSPCWIGKSSTKGQFFPINMLVYQIAKFPLATCLLWNHHGLLRGWCTTRCPRWEVWRSSLGDRVQHHRRGAIGECGLIYIYIKSMVG